MVQVVWPRSEAIGAARWGRAAALVLGFSLLTALTAQIRIPVPWTPVPLTGQTVGVLLTGALLGPRLGMMALLAYLLEGIAGLPVFAGGRAGIGQIVGPTGGYLIAFPLAAGLVGWLAERWGWDRNPRRLLAALLLGSVVIYALGALWLAHFVGGFRLTIAQGILPFLPGDALKALVVAALLPAGWKWIGARRD